MEESTLAKRKVNVMYGDSDEDFVVTPELLAEGAEDDEETLNEDEQALESEAESGGAENELNQLRNDQNIPVERLKEMFDFDVSRPPARNGQHGAIDILLSFR
ncbi:hypothetical protein BIW11_09827 [Tropilaelaps mercedesae]|uniref:Uncharacterized protein n=1 Tax=Tropilaelaps mercedesae TaxID=418985 RepID=A0A1V9XID8_9ACAR|nr:hypothetical protein BIW11_09827 [Tropilaelaps mercedesae]